MNTSFTISDTHTTKRELDEFLSDWLAFQTEYSSVPGLSVAIASCNEDWYSEAFGLRNLEVQSPFTSTTQVDVASQTKLLVLLSILKLVDTGCLDLYESVARYVPHVDGKFSIDLSSVTTYELLTHRSGFPRDFAPGHSSTSLAEVIEKAFEWSGPNRSPAYSNVAYTLLAEIITSTSGETFASYVQREIIEPLAMMQSTFGDCDFGERAVQYGPAIRGERTPVDVPDVDFPGAIGLWSTPSDMCKLVQVFLGMSPNILSKKNKALALATHWGRTGDTDGREFGLGLEVRWMAGLRWLGHTGGAPGSTSATYFSPERGVCFSVVMNARDERILEELTETIATVVEAFLVNSSMAQTAQYQPFVGRYVNELGYRQIVRTPSACFAIDPLQWAPFRQAHQLRIEDETGLRIDGQDFNYANTRLSFASDSMTWGPISMDRCID